jgi:hypothetical protein
MRRPGAGYLNWGRDGSVQRPSRHWREDIWARSLDARDRHDA